MTRRATLAGAKVYQRGTHRIRTPEDTWRWIEPVLPLAGITRLADVTGLDRLGIPVIQAIRPASRNLSVSQGKAVTTVGARVSAAMESLELWHAESLAHLPAAPLSVREMRYANPIDVAQLKWRPDLLLLDAMPIAWLEAASLMAGRTGWLPLDMMQLDYTLPDRFTPQLFYRTSNGLASGNSVEEALLHSLCELIERHALFRCHHDPRLRIPLDPGSLEDEDLRELLRRYREAGIKCVLYDVSWAVGVPVVVVDAVAPDFPTIWRGAGCHPSPRVALSRALTEAAQSRLTHISGARDDLTQFADGVDASRSFERFVVPPPARTLDELPDLATSSVDTDLGGVVHALARAGYEAFWLDLSRPQIGVPVVMSFAPRLKEAPYG